MFAMGSVCPMIVVVVTNVYISICRLIVTMALATVLGLGQSDVDSLVLVAVDIDLADGGTEVAVAQGEVDIAQGDALDMAQEEGPGGELAKHGELRVAVVVFGNLGRLDIGHTLVGTTGSADIDVLEHHVIYRMTGQTGDT